MVAVSLTVAGSLYSIEDAILFRPLRLSVQHRLFRIEFDAAGGSACPVSARDVERLSSLSLPGIERVAGVRVTTCQVAVDGRLGSYNCAAVTPTFFELLGLPVGREASVWDQGAVVSHTFWVDRMRARSDVVGAAIVGKQFDFQTLAVRDRPLRVVSVAPRGFRVPGNTHVWYSPPRVEARMGYLELWILSRERAVPDKTLAVLGAQLRAGRNQALRARPLADAVRPKEAWPVLVLLGISIAVVLAGWVHAASLLAAQTHSSMTTVQTKLALGASVGVLALEVAIDGLLIAAIAWTISQPASAFVTRYLASTLPFLEQRYAAYEGAGMAMTALAAMIGWLVYVGLAALVLARVVRASYAGHRAAVARSFRGSRAPLTLSYVLATAVLYAASCIALSYVRTANRDFGFDTRGLIAINVVPSIIHDWEEASRVAGMVLRSSSDIVSAAGVAGIPFFYLVSEPVSARQTDGGIGAPVVVGVRKVGPNFFHTLGLPLLTGRDFSPGDGRLQVAVVGRKLATTLWPARQPLGGALLVRGKEYRVVGVCADVVDDPYHTDEAQSLVYLASDSPASFVARTKGAPRQVLTALLSEITRRERNVTVNGHSYDELRRTLSKDQRAHAQLVTFILVAAFVVCTLGFHAGLMTVVRGQMKSAAIRLALGGRAHRVILLLGRRLVVWAAVGTLGGTSAALAVAPLVRLAVPRVDAIEPWGIAACVTGMALSILLSSAGPLRTLCRADLVALLKEER
jgi:hypothetical protein